ncbi:MAG: Hsp33 family molecular chaperone HslO [Ignavibacteria bacterium]|nr:Hsp33 family molecular chaperone HslO [Ignavibacteria bacterium]
MGLTLEQYKERARVVSIISEDGKFRGSIIKNTQVAREAQERHSLPAIPALLLARVLSSASLLAVFLNGEERVIVDAIGEGPVSKVSAEAIQVGEVRGFCEYSEIVNTFDKSRFDLALGHGIFRVMRILYNEPDPIIGIVKLVAGDIETDLNYYFAKSEQVFSVALLDSETDTDGKIVNSCGLVLQALPGAEDKDKYLVSEHINKLGKLTSIITPQTDLIEALRRILPWDFKVLKNDRVDFFCRCSKENFVSKLLAMSYHDIVEMRDLGQNELVCRYCNAKYYLTDDDFVNILTQIKAKNN